MNIMTTIVQYELLPENSLNTASKVQNKKQLSEMTVHNVKSITKNKSGSPLRSTKNKTELAQGPITNRESRIESCNKICQLR